MRALAVLCLELVILCGAGCLAASNYQQIPIPTPTPADRTDCGQILGTAFHSEAEQAWFAQNCSAWAPTTLGPVAEQPTPSANASAKGTKASPSPAPSATATAQPQTAAPVQAGDSSQRCDQMRGQPYATDDDRAWFLANCIGSITANPSEPPECAQIRGRPYASEDQRSWFLANCAGSGAQTAPAAPAAAPSDPNSPGREACDQLSGSQNLSPSERQWYETNCR